MKKPNSTIPLLEIQELQTAHLQPAGLALFPTEILMLHGESGAGKTLLLRAIADLDSSNGAVLLNGEPRENLPPSQWRSQVVLVPSESAWWDELVGTHATHWSNNTLQQLGFEPDVLEWQTSRLSSGEKQRLALARALALAPSVLLLDEPTANLDDARTEQVEKLVQDFLTSAGRGVLWVSHDQEQRQRLASRTLRMSNGRLEVED
ncbi:MAG: ABC transporter ATP-binding protein [bacterium]